MSALHPNEVSYHATPELEEFVMGLINHGSDDPFEILSEVEEEFGIPLIHLQLR